MSDIIKRHFYFNSSDSIHRIHGICWHPKNQKIVGVLQIVHGMIEHIDRYDDFARYMCSKGFAVAGEDHLGHGDSISSVDEYGHIHPKKGLDYLVTDVYRLKKHMEMEFEGVPYIILGHSMGSFISRVFISRYSEELDGAIIMGTGSIAPIVCMAGKLLATSMAIFKGWKYHSEMVEKLVFKNYNKRIYHPETKHDWLTKDEKIVAEYEKDPKCGFSFTLAAYRVLFDLVLQVGKIDCINNIKESLPILLTSGEMDPVGNYGNAVYDVYDKFKEADLENVTLKLYDSARHEILNETEKEEVYEDIYIWIKNLF